MQQHTSVSCVEQQCIMLFTTDSGERVILTMIKTRRIQALSSESTPQQLHLYYYDIAPRTTT